MVDNISVFNKDWWGNCTNTLGYEVKQILYAEKIGLVRTETYKSPFVFNMSGASVFDFSGGPVSLLLKCVDCNGTLLEPTGSYPRWVYDRYTALGIEYVVELGENLIATGYNEAWVIDCLQHTLDPELVLRNAKKSAKTVRVFEWINTISSKNSPHIITESFLNRVLGVKGSVEYMNVFGYTGYCYFTVVSGSN